ncbi:sulfurtransferase complex subunit TusC [Pseudohongiella spirulinae]|uniref:DsrE/DsrF-like family n=1 Tax=Pseudohongiella spirulinae TaxID=1249552 RepID=A0A0S2KD07_9GAMM|nr:sulfurtransferase complex subunit TusC [Pseudohongiella spirulinae]ALO46202.1 DsrE/DsrF-like family [Pseudohongiella spirulinae]
MSKNKVISLIIRQAPYGSSRAKATLDMALSAAVFEQSVQLIFMDDGVFQLLAKQDPAAIGAKNTSAALTALPLYGIETVYVASESLQQRGLAAEDLSISARVSGWQEISALLHRSDTVISL